MDVARVSKQAPSTQPQPAQQVAQPVPVPTTPVTPQAPVAQQFQPASQERSTREKPEIPDTLRRAITAVNASIATHSRHISINFHEATGRRVVTVYDSETNEAIREIPPESVLDAHAGILELAGFFVNTKG